jgi:hypothetical protein
MPYFLIRFELMLTLVEANDARSHTREHLQQLTRPGGRFRYKS